MNMNVMYKSNHFQKLMVFGLIVGLMSGCTFAKVKSVKSPGVDQKITKVLFTLNRPVQAGSFDFYESFMTALMTEFKKYNVESVGYVFDQSKEIPQHELNEEIRKYNPDVVISILHTKAIQDQTLQYAGGVKLELQMNIPNQSKPVWSAKMKVVGNFLVSSKSGAKKSAANIVEKLKADGMIVKPVKSKN
jgi:hypothetical protein